MRRREGSKQKISYEMTKLVLIEHELELELRDFVVAWRCVLAFDCRKLVRIVLVQVQEQLLRWYTNLIETES